MLRDCLLSYCDWKDFLLRTVHDRNMMLTDLRGVVSHCLSDVSEAVIQTYYMAYSIIHPTTQATSLCKARNRDVNTKPCRNKNIIYFFPSRVLGDTGNAARVMKLS